MFLANPFKAKISRRTLVVQPTLLCFALGIINRHTSLLMRNMLMFPSKLYHITKIIAQHVFPPILEYPPIIKTVPFGIGHCRFKLGNQIETWDTCESWLSFNRKCDRFTPLYPELTFPFRVKRIRPCWQVWLCLLGALVFFLVVTCSFWWRSERIAFSLH